MRSRRVLVVTKESRLDREGDTIPDTLRAALLRRDLENRQAVYDVFQALAVRRVRFEIVRRRELRSSRGFDLVIIVGGDGTFMAASHAIESTPVLAVNSDPASSMAVFSCCDRHTFAKSFDQAMKGRLPRTRFNRLRLSIGGAAVLPAITNDVLFAHRNPAVMARYTLRIGSREEDQRSSGIWISTAAGSTGGSLSAGGRVLPIRSRAVQYVVREPYFARRKARLVRGVTQSRIEVTPHVSGMVLFVDGPAVVREVRAGETFSIRTPGPALNVLGYRDSRRRALFPR